MMEFRLPSLGADMEEGTLLEWRVRPGDAVKRGQVVAVVDTSKAAIDVECWDEGTVDQLIVGPDTKIPVGSVLALLRAPGETPEQAAQWKAQHPVAVSAPAPAAAVSAPTAAQVPVAAGLGRLRASPAARRRAEELGVTLAAVTGSGPQGAITLEDVERAAAPAHRLSPEELARRRIAPAARRHAEEQGVDLDAVMGTGPQGAVTVEDVERAAVERQAKAKTRAPDRAGEMRRAIAAAMARSKREIPHYYLTGDIPLAAATRWLAAENEKRPVTARLVMAVLFIKAVAKALEKFPELNGFYRDGNFEPSSAIHIGVAISLRQGGLIAPAILDANTKPLDQLMRELSDLVKRARALSLKSSEISLPTATLTNLGDQGVDSVLGVIYPPQVALIGFGKVAERAWAETGAIHITPTVTASLAADHRASDGHRGGLFLNELKTLLQQPEKL